MRWLTLFVTGAFIVLSSYAYGKAQHSTAHHLTHATARPVTIWRSKTVLAWRDKRAAIAADIWGLKPDELETATNIFGK